MKVEETQNVNVVDMGDIVILDMRIMRLDFVQNADKKHMWIFHVYTVQ